MRHVTALLALTLTVAPALAHADTAIEVLALPRVQARTGDFDAMLKRRAIRILVVPSKTYFFLDRGDTLGLTAEIGREFEKWINKRHAKGPYDIKVVFVPTQRDRIFQALRDGKGDIAAAMLTVTPDRAAVVDFAAPWTTNVKEVLVTGPFAPAITTLADLSGQKVMVRASSSYYTHLVAFNARLKAESRAPVITVNADEHLEDEDLMQMVAGGLLPWAIVDEPKAKLWARILKGVTVHSDVALNEGGEIAWAIRKNSPLLKREIAAFVSERRKFAEDLGAQYLYDGRIVRNALAADQLDKFKALIGFFKTYGERYRVDPYILAAQGFQESAFDQKLRMKSGAVGIMQMKPSTAREELGINDIVTHAEDNIHAGAAYLRFLVNKYLNDPTIPEREKVLMTLAAYNAGPGNLKKFRDKARAQGFDPNLWFDNVEQGAAAVVGQETVQYVGNIYKYYIAYSRLLAAEPQATAEKGK